MLIDPGDARGSSHASFPALAGEAERTAPKKCEHPGVVAEPTSSQPGGEAITPAGLAALAAELEKLEKEGRRAMGERLLAARSLGDLKENAEYHIAKDDQAHLETRIKRLRARLRDAVIVEEPDATRFAFGRTAEVVEEDSGRVYTWTIVGATEADVANGKLSVESPVAKALLGSNPGDAVQVQTPRGPRRYRIEKLLP